MRTRRSHAAVFSASALAVVAVGVAGCSSATSSSPTTSSTTTTSTPPPEVVTPTTVINGTSVVVPTEVAGHPISSGTATGGQIIITTKGILPFRLFTNMGQTVTFTNLTSKPVSVRSDFYDYFRSGPIKPGGTFTWSSPTSVNVGYTSSNGYKGLIAVGAFPS